MITLGIKDPFVKAADVASRLFVNLVFFLTKKTNSHFLRY